jgi:hypothetical protein
LLLSCLMICSLEIFTTAGISSFSEKSVIFSLITDFHCF